MLTSYEQHSRAKFITILISIVVVAGAIVLLDHLRSVGPTGANTTKTSASTSAPTVSDDTDTAPSSASSASSPTATAGDTASGYKDGTYTASVSYFVPPGKESIQVNMTVQNGTITEASIKNSENDFDSQGYQEDFTSAYKALVVGKKISGLHLNTVAGASETTQGFNDAVSKIASQAQA